MQKLVNGISLLNFWNLFGPVMFRDDFDYLRGKIRGGSLKQMCSQMVDIQLLFCNISKFSSVIWTKRGLNIGISFSFSLFQTATVPVILICSTEHRSIKEAVKIQSFYVAFMNEMSVAASRLEVANGSRWKFQIYTASISSSLTSRHSFLFHQAHLHRQISSLFLHPTQIPRTHITSSPPSTNSKSF